ncbi:MAG: FecR domain-containing protein [Oligoflexia bacterium]|nr:FecR domain-containing protein [Oligoflexia bacterium]
MKILITLLFSIFCILSHAKNVAKVVIIRGKVTSEYKKEVKTLKKGDWVVEGSKIKTEKKSFVKFLFIDKSQMNLGPKSEMQIKTFPKDDAGIINLIKGKVRAKVSKNYMNIDKKKSKLFIKTKNAAMGVRGTEMQIIYNPERNTTSLLTFEGAVAMARIDNIAERVEINSLRKGVQDKLDDILSSDKAVIVREGEYSGANPNVELPTPPVKISPTQLEMLKADEKSMMKESIDQKKTSSNDKKEKKKVRSMIPKGMDAKLLGKQKVDMKAEIGNVLGDQMANKIATKATVEMMESKKAYDSFGSGNESNMKPEEMGIRPGGLIDMSSGMYINPSENSMYDENAGVYIMTADQGAFDVNSGEFVLADGKMIDENGNIVDQSEGGRFPASIDGGLDPTASGDPMLAGDMKEMEEMEEMAEEYMNEVHDQYDGINDEFLIKNRSKVQFRISIK